MVTDASIVKALRDYREGLNFSNAGGYHKIKHYLRRDYDYHLNHKKPYRLYKQEGLLLPHQKRSLKRTALDRISFGNSISNMVIFMVRIGSSL
ncbi:TPA: transposase [Candidatus Poribacteria bacterium]|nr:transposase [Candidatus Poribacteria bacterium]HIB99719.1 transposase [Candidatus Poribacteria bacterium]HIN27430.1 transposase [Candidatus Poribacteria bacterium]HIP08771.1 transposase [Rhodospirillales bacterium]